MRYIDEYIKIIGLCSGDGFRWIWKMQVKVVCLRVLLRCSICRVFRFLLFASKCPEAMSRNSRWNLFEIKFCLVWFNYSDCRQIRRTWLIWVQARELSVLPAWICDRIFRNLIRGGQKCRAAVENVREIRPQIGGSLLFRQTKEPRRANPVGCLRAACWFLMASGL